MSQPSLLVLLPLRGHPCALPPTGARRAPRRSRDSVSTPGPPVSLIVHRAPVFTSTSNSALGLSLRHLWVTPAVATLCRARSSRASSTRLSAQPEGTIRVTLRCPRAAKSSTKGRDLCVDLPLRPRRFLGTTLLPPLERSAWRRPFLHRYRLR